MSTPSHATGSARGPAHVLRRDRIEERREEPAPRPTRLRHHSPPALGPEAAPVRRRVWALLSYRAGESQQILGLAEALASRFGWDWEPRRLCYRILRGAPLSLAQRVGLAGVEPTRSDPLRPPWPDLVISAGLRNEPVARWIRAASGGRTRLVHLGRPWAPRNAFDLLVTTPQYRIDDAPNVLENPTTLHRVTSARLAAERTRWAPIFAELPSPRIGVLMGGTSGPFTLGPRAGMRLSAAARRAAGSGCVVATTSPRTHPAAAEAFATALAPRDLLWRWQPGADDNPYFGVLAWADELIVTGDSIAMLSEAVATGRPVWMFDLGGMRPGAPAPGPWDRSLSAASYAALMRLGPTRLTRDLRRVHAGLVDSGRAAWLGDPAPSPSDAADPAFEATLQRVAALMDAPVARAPAAPTSAQLPQQQHHQYGEPQYGQQCHHEWG